MTATVHVAGVGMIPVAKPGKSASYSEMGEQAARAALIDAGLEYSQVQQAHVGYVYGDSTSGQAALYGLGQTGIPIFNVNNNCSTGSWALWLARQAVAGGTVDCALALGFEQMVPGALASVYSDRPNPLTRFETVRDELQQVDPQADQGRRQRRPARHDDRIDPAGPARHPRRGRRFGGNAHYPEADYVSGQIIATGDGLEA